MSEGCRVVISGVDCVYIKGGQGRVPHVIYLINGELELEGGGMSICQSPYYR